MKTVVMATTTPSVDILNTNNNNTKLNTAIFTKMDALQAAAMLIQQQSLSSNQIQQQSLSANQMPIHLQYRGVGMDTVSQVLDANSDCLSDAANASAHEAAEAAAMLTYDFSSSSMTSSAVTSLDGLYHVAYNGLVMQSDGNLVYIDAGTQQQQQQFIQPVVKSPDHEMATMPLKPKTKRSRQRTSSSTSSVDILSHVGDTSVTQIGSDGVMYTVSGDNSMTHSQHQQAFAGVKRNRSSQGGTAAGDGGTSGEISRELVYVCHTCGATFSSDKYLSMHTPTHNVQTPVNELTADRLMQSNIERHFAASSSSTPSAPSLLDTASGKVIVVSGNSGGTTWSCKICNKIFAQNSNFKNHMRTHSDERPYVCEVCNIGFKERYHLKKHHLFKHTNELKEKCRVCGKLFKDSTAVRAHERIHSEERPYSCRRCGKSFKTSECLWHHENRSKTCGLAGMALARFHDDAAGSGEVEAAAAAPQAAKSRKRASTGKIQGQSDDITVNQQVTVTPTIVPNKWYQLPFQAELSQQQSIITQSIAPSIPTSGSNELVAGFTNSTIPQPSRPLAFFIPTGILGNQQSQQQTTPAQAPRVAIIRPMQPASTSTPVTITSQSQPPHQQQPPAVSSKARFQAATMASSASSAKAMAERDKILSIIAAHQQPAISEISSKTKTSSGQNQGHNKKIDDLVEIQSLTKATNTVKVFSSSAKPEPIEVIENELTDADDDSGMLAEEVEVKTTSPEPTLASETSTEEGGRHTANSKKFACATCNKPFASRVARDKHALIHSESRPYKCEECGVGFKLKVHLKKHTLYRHSDDKPCSCTVCGKKFKDSSAVRLHERIHSTQRPFLCECGKTFKTKENLWGHRHRGPCDKMTLSGAIMTSSSFSDEISTASSSNSPESSQPDTEVTKRRSSISSSLHGAIASPSNISYLSLSAQGMTSARQIEGHQPQAPSAIRLVKKDQLPSIAGNRAGHFITPVVRLVDATSKCNTNTTLASPIQKDSALPPFETFAPNVAASACASAANGNFKTNNSSSSKLPAIYGIFQQQQQQLTGSGIAAVSTSGLPVVISPTSPSTVNVKHSASPATSSQHESNSPTNDNNNAALAMIGLGYGGAMCMAPGPQGTSDCTLPIYYWADDVNKHTTPLVVWQAAPTGGVFHESGFSQL